LRARVALARSASRLRQVEHRVQRFRDWVKADVFKRMFDAVSDDPDMEYAMIDATIVKVHRHGQGAKGTQSQAIGKSKGGWTTKILVLTDALGNLVRFVLLPGNASTRLASRL